MLKMNHISKIFPGVKALDDISIEIGQGEIHGLVAVSYTHLTLPTNTRV